MSDWATTSTASTVRPHENSSAASGRPGWVAEAFESDGSMNPSQMMLLLTYTPRSDAEAREYDQWLQEVDNPFFNVVPGVVEYINWKIVAQKLGTVPFTHFDTMFVEDEAAVERIWSNLEVQRFADGWRELWALNPGAEDMSPNYQVTICRETASGDSHVRTPYAIFVPHIKAPDWREREYDVFLRDVGTRFLNSQSEIVHSSNWRVVGSILGSVWFSDFDLIYVERTGAFNRLAADPEMVSYTREWARRWGYDREGGLAANCQIALAEVIAAPRVT